MRLPIPKKQHQRGLILILFLGVLICILQLGSTGLVDETPSLFAASSRAMSQTGDWLTPRVNGLPRFDKPPLVYWLMGFFYSLPGQNFWDPLGTWSARLPSAISTILMMLFLGDTLMKWPSREDDFPRRTALVTSLAFALSPLVVIWSRIAVSDALLCSCLGISMLLTWRTYVNPFKGNWIWGWIVLGLAILTKGPVALAITIMALFFFGFSEKNFKKLFNTIKPFRGILISLAVSIPWYILELIKEGKPFWDSFFGYHNFQRLTSVVNSHSEPWWFFCLILIIASLPFTPFLLLGIYDFFNSLFSKHYDKKRPVESLFNFACCWLISIFLLFTFAATKLPSYWLPATPSAAIIIGLTSAQVRVGNTKRLLILFSTTIILASFSIALILMKFWVYKINDPEMPDLSNILLSSNINTIGSVILFLASLSAIYLIKIKDYSKIIFIQIPLILFQLFFMLPLWNISDNLRQLPLRNLSKLVISTRLENEQLAMVGINKPSLHFYTRQIVIYEKETKEGLINLSERIELEKRDSRISNFSYSNKPQTILLVIDQTNSKKKHWEDLRRTFIGKYSIYELWRVRKKDIDEKATKLRDYGLAPDWREFDPERI